MQRVERVSELTSGLTQSSESHGRSGTDGLTKTDSPTSEISANATQAGGLKGFIDKGAGSEQRAAQPRDSRNRSIISPASPVPVRYGFAAPSQNNYQLRKAQSSAGRPLTCETSQAASTPLTRRIQVLNVGTHRHHFAEEVACSPVARWRGRSDGSDPLRPPADPAAGRYRRRPCLSLDSTAADRQRGATTCIRSIPVSLLHDTSRSA